MLATVAHVGDFTVVDNPTPSVVDVKVKWFLPDESRRHTVEQSLVANLWDELVWVSKQRVKDGAAQTSVSGVVCVAKTGHEVVCTHWVAVMVGGLHCVCLSVIVQATHDFVNDFNFVGFKWYVVGHELVVQASAFVAVHKVQRVEVVFA